jgi:long-subunit acyl-CoA synthetase (AMP-forming)
VAAQGVCISACASAGKEARLKGFEFPKALQLERAQLAASDSWRIFLIDACLSHAAAGKEARLKGFEFPKALHLDPEPFSIEHDLITPKLSLKRPQLLKYYKAKVNTAL